MIDEKQLQEVYTWIDEHQDDIIHDLIDVASIESVSDADDEVKPFGQGCINVLERMLDKGKQAGFETHNFENYVGSILYDASKEENIGIWAHLDVVPAGEGWMSDPYTPVIRDGFLFGRGVGDDKSGAIGGFYIQQAFRALNIPLNHNIQLFLGTNEEKGMADIDYYVPRYPVPKFSFVPDAGFPGVAGEFGRLRYVLSSKNALSDDFVDMYSGTVFNIIPNKATVVLAKDTGIAYQELPDSFEVEETEEGIRITAFGVSSHAAGPERGVNAIKVLTSELVKLEGLKADDLAILSFIDHVNDDCYGGYLGFAKSDDISGQTVSSGTVLRLEEGRIHLTNDCRFCVTDTGDNILSFIEAKCDENDYEVEVVEKTTPYYLDKEGSAVKAVLAAYEKYTGEVKDIHIGKGGTYAGKIPNAMATGAVLRGNIEPPAYIEPGHGGAHQPDEFIPIDGYMEGIKLLATMILYVDDAIA